MKRTKHISYLIHAFIALALIGTASACVEYQGPNSGYGTNGKLSVKGIVSEATVITRAGTTPSVETLKEKELNTLDVFVEHVTNGTGDGEFIRQYHLPFPVTEGDPAAIQEGANNLLAEHWASEGLVIGEKYNIYVATNNTQTKGNKDLSTFNVTTLKALVADEITDGKALIDDYNNIAAPWSGAFSDTPSGNIYKQYISDLNSVRTGQYNSVYGFTDDKEFMMDGVINNWTPDPTKMDQVFDVTLNRAAAKFVLNVKFDADFLMSLTHTKTDRVDENNKPIWEPKPVAEQVTIDGAPGWKFYNFAFGAPVFTPAEQGDGVKVHNSGTMLLHPYEYEGTDKHFQIITYSYPNKWLSTNYATEAPSLVITVMYSDSNDPHYYRIPLVKSTVTAIERNHIYVINATIATRGSDTHEDVDEIKNIVYEVLPWNDESNSAAIHDEVESVQHYYFKVNPKVYTLRGDGDQDVVLTYLKAAGTKVNWKLFTYDENGNQTGVVANNADGATRAWFYNADGAFTTTYNDNESGMNWSNTGPTPMGVKIEQSTEGTSGSTGTVTVTSHALNNRAIKYIRLRVYLDEAATFINGKESMYEDIIIRHFPTDNIQNIVGSWSSYHAAGSGTQEVTLTTTSLVEAEAWKEQYGVNYTTQELPATDYISYAEYSDHAGETGYTMTGPTTVSRNAFLAAVQTNNNRRNANSQANAVADAGEGNNYYWGTGVQTVATNVRSNDVWYYDYDYYTDGTQNNRYNLYRYTNYNSASYTHTYTYTLYSMTVQMVSTGNWFDIADLGQTYSGNARKINANSNFFAKVFDDGVVNAVVVNYNGNSKTYTLKHGNNYDYYYYWNGSSTSYMQTYFNHTNNHMYVIQISSTSVDYVIGRPILGTPNANLSRDDVVSPAFMIASQLGAVSPFNDAASAATHCSRYMEVAANGTRYTGWRLPTPDEISVITRYQNGTINGVTITNSSYQAMTPVLTGGYYWSLTGNSVSTGLDDDGPYLRCVRDLSAAEVEALNGFDAIIEKYQQHQ